MVLSVNAASLDQVDQATGKVLCSYDYKDMEGLVTVSTALALLQCSHTQPHSFITIFVHLIQLTDFPGGICVIHGGFNRLVGSADHMITHLSDVHLPAHVYSCSISSNYKTRPS